MVNKYYRIAPSFLYPVLLLELFDVISWYYRNKDVKILFWYQAFFLVSQKRNYFNLT